VVVGVLRTADALRRTFTQLLEPYDITLQQYNVLRILRGSGEPVPTLEIGERLIEQTPGVTRLIDRLEAKGLVERYRSQVDRRVVGCSISREGLRLLEELDPLMEEADLAPMESLSEGEQKLLVALLERVWSAALESGKPAVN
jgi:DNA-binding MarR family transcriptional regulator